MIRELRDRHTYHGWTWVEGYQLDVRGEAVAKRELFVLREGLRWLPPVALPPGRRSARAQLTPLTPAAPPGGLTGRFVTWARPRG
ncbi:cytochrome P450 [Micromonospora sp. NBC_01655]|uniref:hypothetical protein n=1 Tax=Micromonospora sp. NBC_01655 TaxID=2975983 RepID=UPI0022519139|nr:hypothetical protein [Micromonospora sp. NBC_01655]MCX4472339.1 cytochrome P450 [Micromonospora sp. NBC_01655]